jgi:hypothetical protein
VSRGPGAARSAAWGRDGAGRRALLSLWILIAAATAASGALTASLTAPASPAAGLGVAVSGTVLAVSLALAVRVVAALERARPRSRRPFGQAWEEFRASRRRRAQLRGSGVPRHGGRSRLRFGEIPAGGRSGRSF